MIRVNVRDRAGNVFAYHETDDATDALATAGRWVEQLSEAFAGSIEIVTVSESGPWWPGRFDWGQR